MAVSLVVHENTRIYMMGVTCSCLNDNSSHGLRSDVEIVAQVCLQGPNLSGYRRSNNRSFNRPGVRHATNPKLPADTSYGVWSRRQATDGEGHQPTAVV